MHEHFHKHTHSSERNYNSSHRRASRFWEQFAPIPQTIEGQTPKGIQIRPESVTTALRQFQKDPITFIHQGKTTQYAQLARDVTSFKSHRGDFANPQLNSADYLIGMLVFGKALDVGARNLNAPGIKITESSKKKLLNRLTSGLSYLDGTSREIRRMLERQQPDFINISKRILAGLTPAQIQSFLQGAADLNFMFQESAKSAKAAKAVRKSQARG